MKETYTRIEMLAFDVTEDELVAAENGDAENGDAENGDVKCICFPWVSFFFFLLPLVFLILFL